MGAAMSIDRRSLPYEHEVVSIKGVPREEPTDGDLIERVGNGDRDAFEELYRRYTRPVLGLALRRLGDRGRAEDAFQDAFAAIWRSASSYDPERGRGGGVALHRRPERDRRRRAAPARAADGGAGRAIRRRRPGRACGGVVAHLARASSARAAARARTPGDRARVLGRPLAERDLGVPRRPAGHGQDADSERARAARGPARGGALDERRASTSSSARSRIRTSASGSGACTTLLLSVDPPPEVSPALHAPLPGRAGATACRAGGGRRSP